MANKRNRLIPKCGKFLAGLVAALFTASSLNSTNTCLKDYEYTPQYTKKELHCLALNAYHEARGEGFYGMQLVSKVVLNRVAHKQWPNSICNVIYQPYQFSWTHQKVPSVLKSSTAWKEAVLAAKTAYQLSHIKSTYYHTTYVNPKWNKSFSKEKVYKNHIFYTPV